MPVDKFELLGFVCFMFYDITGLSLTFELYLYFLVYSFVPFPFMTC
jgi:hypothetical protein